MFLSSTLRSAIKSYFADSPLFFNMHARYGLVVWRRHKEFLPPHLSSQLPHLLLIHATEVVRGTRVEKDHNAILTIMRTLGYTKQKKSDVFLEKKGCESLCLSD